MSTAEEEEEDDFVLKLKDPKDLAAEEDEAVHTYGDGVICTTDKVGHATPGGFGPAELVVDATEGFIPLWERGSVLRWRFNEQALSLISNADEGRKKVRSLLSKALLKWGDAAPVRFAERSDSWDFEIVIRNADQCSPRGCTYARAFFPDSGRHDLLIYPKLFTQSGKEQVETLVHELGHIFGLRHFFAKISEKKWPSELFGEHNPFSIMNYGAKSKLTKADKRDLRALYHGVWSGSIKEINGTPVRLVKPYHA